MGLVDSICGKEEKGNLSWRVSNDGDRTWKINSQQREMGKRLDKEDFEKWCSITGFSLVA